MSYSNWEYQNIALAVVSQCALLVNRLATQGTVDVDSMNACLNPLVVFKPESVADIYPSVGKFAPGLRILQEVFSNENKGNNAEIARYVLGLLLISTKLMKNNAMQQKIHSGLIVLSPLFRDLNTHGNSNSAEHDKLFRQLADIYQTTISTLTYRIHIKGDVNQLKNELIASRIRALLLAGIRSAVLWHQLGGRRWHLLIYRNRVKQTVSHIRKNLITLV